ncbi:MAG: PLP-dependent aminotransferase family protein [Neomegalonema sp.]|nr:PLP-dependent aminotransferase family protein [Neomegalonema sp.]
MRVLVIDRSDRRPLALQIAEELRRRIMTGELAAGASLPPSRQLANDLGLARSTIVTAYEQLIAEGYVVARRGAGSFVSEAPAGRQARRVEPERRPRLAQRPHAMFAPGAPDMRLFPYHVWSRTAARALRAWPERSVAASDPFGDLELRRAIVQHLAEWRGVRAEPEQVLITAGSGNGLEICIAALAARDRPIALEDPGYPEVRRFVERLGCAIENLSVGPEGVGLPSGRPCMAVLTPSHQYPMGGAMPLARRLAFLNWAEAADAWIIEDDYDSEFRYSGAPIPALSALAGEDWARSGRVLYLGSFSKVFSTELRIGFLVLPADLIAKVGAAALAAGAKASAMPQPALARFMLDGDFHKHIRRVRRSYAERRAALMDALGASLAARIVNPAHRAGMHLALPMADLATERAALARADHYGLGMRSLSACAASENGVAGLRLGYCAHTPDEIYAQRRALRECASAAP